MTVREDGKIAYFSPEAKQGIVLTQPEEKWVFVEMVKAGHPEIMPERILNGLGMAFGRTSKTGWEKLVSLSKKIGGEVV